MKQAVLVFNPLAGRRAVPAQLAYLVERFQRGGVLVQPYCFSADSAGGLVDLLHRGRYDFLAAAGGDGTLNSVANRLLKNNLDLPLGIIPSGTSNDLARCLNLPSTLTGCLEVILAGNTREIDAGLIDHQIYFLSTCAGGLFVNSSFNANLGLKKYLGPLAYYFEALREASSIRTFDLRITLDGRAFQEQVVLFLVSNGKNAAGFSNLIDDADLSDGLLDVLLIRQCSHLELLRLLYQAFNGIGLSGDCVVKLKGKHCVIESSRDVQLSIDGEKGGTLPCKITIVRRPLRVLA